MVPLNDPGEGNEAGIGLIYIYAPVEPASSRIHCDSGGEQPIKKTTKPMASPKRNHLPIFPVFADIKATSFLADHRPFHLITDNPTPKSLCLTSFLKLKIS